MGQLGIMLGSTPVTSFARLHSLLSSAILTTNDETIIFSRSFLKAIDSQLSYDEHPIYFLLHESIYADGGTDSATNWAAYRALSFLTQENDEWDYNITAYNDDDKPVLFYGEMIFPFMVHDFAELSGKGMTSLANALASKQD